VTNGVPRHEISINNAVLIIAFGNRSKRLKNQCYLEFTIGYDGCEGAFLVSFQLVNLVILGCDFDLIMVLLIFVTDVLVARKNELGRYVLVNSMSEKLKR
jgi:hypothetical protein